MSVPSYMNDHTRAELRQKAQHALAFAGGLVQVDAELLLQILDLEHETLVSLREEVKGITEMQDDYEGRLDALEGEVSKLETEAAELEEENVELRQAVSFGEHKLRSDVRLAIAALKAAIGETA